MFPKRWSNARSGRSGYAPACANEWAPRICDKPRIKCRECPNQAFIPVTAEVIGRHLRGRGADGRDFTIGVYPMLADETCWFLAIDFDKKTWHRDAAVFLETCRALGVASVLERSRSGNGGHVWIFFTDPVPAAAARRLGAWLLTESMERNPDIGFESYDRLFPNQDTLPAGGFGNLIALPLQHLPRQAGNSVFLDDEFQPHADQWSFLSSVRRMTPAEVADLTDEAGRRGRVVGVRLPVVEKDDAPWLAPPSRKRPEVPITDPLPDTVEVVFGDQMYVDRAELPASLVNRLARLAAFQNPQFYSAQGMRLPTYGIPRVIGCAELLSHHVALPRGCRDQVEALLSSLGVDLRPRDERNRGRPLATTFEGELTQEQDAAADAMLRHDTGVLAATTAFGKTVVAASLIAARGTNTIVLVHRRQLLDQWRARLASFLDLPAEQIGQIGGGKRRPTGVVDVAVIQSLVRKGEVDDLVADYGHLVVDECHHLSAVSFEAVARRCKARYVLGLSATVARRDGARNELIVDDVLGALESGRSPIVLTERKEHILRLAERLSRSARNVVVLHGGLGQKARRELASRLESIADAEERVLIATGHHPIIAGRSPSMPDACTAFIPPSAR